RDFHVTGVQTCALPILHGFHGKRHTNGLEFVDPVQDPWLEVNTVYTDENTVVDGSLQEYQRSTMPFFLIEARYEGEFGAGAYVEIGRASGRGRVDDSEA